MVRYQSLTFEERRRRVNLLAYLYCGGYTLYTVQGIQQYTVDLDLDLYCSTVLYQ